MCVLWIIHCKHYKRRGVTVPDYGSRHKFAYSKISIQGRSRWFSLVLSLPNCCCCVPHKGSSDFLNSLRGSSDFNLNEINLLVALYIYIYI